MYLNKCNYTLVMMKCCIPFITYINFKCTDNSTIAIKSNLNQVYYISQHQNNYFFKALETIIV